MNIIDIVIVDPITDDELRLLALAVDAVVHELAEGKTYSVGIRTAEVAL